ncbi:MAG: hypothetical protein E7606_04380 [Ruminococcaceae bacterium]|nr:hypothetical protein [Oscillospiraceae bacterium]
MIFKTHDLPQRYRATKGAKIALTVCGVMCAFIPILALVAIVIETHTFIAPFCVTILPFLLICGIWAIILYDMKRAFVEFDGDKIAVTDYYFGIKREKIFLKKDVLSVEITKQYPTKVRGYYFSGRGLSDLEYIVFRGEKNKYLLKLIGSEETKTYVEKHFEVTNT